MARSAGAITLRLTGCQLGWRFIYWISCLIVPLSIIAVVQTLDSQTGHLRSQFVEIFKGQPHSCLPVFVSWTLLRNFFSPQSNDFCHCSRLQLLSFMGQLLPLLRCEGTLQRMYFLPGHSVIPRKAIRRWLLFRYHFKAGPSQSPGGIEQPIKASRCIGFSTLLEDAVRTVHQC